MNKQLILVASLALALGGPAFAQSYSTPTTPANPTSATQPMSGNAAVLAPSVPPVISASAPQPTAANHYDPRKDFKTKVYPTTDKAHTSGDPPVIDHSADIAPVANPTTSVAAVPPSG